jgi:serine/threonine protein kinase
MRVSNKFYVILPIPYCLCSHLAGVGEVAVKAHNPKWEFDLTKEQLKRFEDEITARDSVTADALTDTESVDTGGDISAAKIEKVFPDLRFHEAEFIPPEFLSMQDGNFAGEYILKDLVKHDEAHLMIGQHSVFPKAPRLLFKYEMNCVSNSWIKFCKKKKTESCLVIKRDSEALLHEYIYTRIVYERLGLAPKPIVISPPILMRRQNMSATEGKTSFSLFDQPGDQADDCVKVKTTVRVLVEELVGPTISDYFKKFTKEVNLLKKDNVLFSAKIFKKSIQMIEQLHAIGLIHGDFHYGNLAFRGNPTEELELVFIDFGTAKFYPSDESSAEAKPSSLRYYFFSPSLLSPFQLEGYPAGRRDDIYRAFEAFMNVLVHGSLERLFDDPNNARDLASMKSETDYCSPGTNYPGLSHLRSLLSEETFPQVFADLLEIQTYVRERQLLVSSEPDYPFLVQIAQNIIDNLQQ